MKKYQFRRYVLGSAPYVINHAKFQASKGRNPSTPFKGIYDPRLALAAAKQEMQDRDAQEIAFSSKISQEVISRPRTWREDSRIGEYPTVNFEVVHSRDLVGARSVYKAEVFHVNTTHGKGFRGNASCGGTMSSTNTFIGTEEAQYEQALQGALLLLEKYCEESEISLKNRDDQERDCHNGTDHKRRLAKLSKSTRTKLSHKRPLTTSHY